MPSSRAPFSSSFPNAQVSIRGPSGSDFHAHSCMYSDDVLLVYRPETEAQYGLMV